MKQARRLGMGQVAAMVPSRLNWQQTLRRQALWMALTMALGLPAAQAQVHPDGSTATRTDTAANGVPVINVAAPNSAGLSHNRYQQFDVGSAGLILNNSGAISNTQLAGFISGNPNLSNGASAKLILNEVTSNLASHLNGVTEVAGNRAEVIIANPNGIECTGCGFINTPRGVLTTGTPIFAGDGSLSALRVSGGNITVDGQGLDASKADRVDLLARSVTINAGLWANQLNVVTGANQVDYRTLATQAIAGSGAAPAVALDVSAIGGMYAGVIRLVGTEAGLGVNNQGQIAAQAGDLILTNNGQVLLAGKASATGTVTVGAAQSVSTAGTLAAGGALNVSSGGDLSLGGTTYSGAGMSLSALGGLSNAGQLQAQGGALSVQAGGAFGNRQGATIYASGPINLGAASVINAGVIEAAQEASVRSSGSLTNSGVVQSDSGSLSLHGLVLGNSGSLSAAGNLALAGDQQLSSSGNVIANGAVSLQAPTLSTSGVVQAGTTLGIVGGSLSNSGKLYSLGGDQNLQLSGGLSNLAGGDIYSVGAFNASVAGVSNQGALEAKQNVSLSSLGDVTNQATIQADNGSLGVTSAGQLSNVGTLSAGTQATLNGTRGVNNSGTLVASRDIALGGGQLLNSGTVQAGGALRMSGASLSNLGKLYALGGDWTAELGGALLNTGGDIYASDNLRINAAALSNSGGIEAARALTLSVTGAASSSGTMQADAGDLTLNADALDSSGSLSASGNLTATTTHDLSSSGNAVANGNVTLSAGRLITAGTVQAAQALSLSSQGDLLNSGKLYALGGGWNAQVGGDFTSQAHGDIYGAGALSLQAQSLHLDGALEAAQAATLRIAGALNNLGTLQTDHGDLSLTAASLTNAGTISAAGTLGIQLGGQLGNIGVMVSGGTFNLSAAALNNQAGGQLQSTGDLLIDAANISNAGSVYAKGNASIDSGDLSNAAGAQLLADGALNLNARGDVSNAGVLQAGSDLTLTQARSLDNALNATVYAGRNVTLGLSQQLSNHGLLYAASLANLTATSITNDGTVRSGGSLGVTSLGDLTSSGAIQAQQNLSLSAGGALANSGKLYAVDGDLTLQAGGLLGSTGTGDIYSGGQLSVAGAGFSNAGLLEAVHSVAISATGDALNSGSLQSDQGDLAFNANTLSNQGTVSASGALRLSGTQSLGNSGSMVSGQAMQLDAAAFTNSGQLQAAADVALRAAAVSNSGRLQAGGALAISGNRSVSNSATGQLLAGGALSADSTDQLDNAGIMQAGGALQIQGAAMLNNRAGGTLYGTQSTTLTLSNGLVNAGTIYGGRGVDLSVYSLSNSGSLRSGNGLTVTVTGVASNSGDSYALGDAIWNVGGALNNTGVLAGAGNTTLTAASLDGAGTLAAGLRADGSLGDSGDLSVTTSGTLGSHGQALAGGNLFFTGGTIDLSSSRTRAGSNASLSATQGVIANQGGDLAANGRLGLTAAAGLLNGGASASLGGRISAATLALQLPSIDNRYGSMIQSGSGDLGITLAGALANAHGTVATNAGNLSIQAASLDNTGGSIQLASNGLLKLVTSGDLGNNSGQIVGNGALQLDAGGSLTNAAGAIGGSGDITVDAAALDNSGGSLAGRNVGLNLTQALTNNRGTVQASGTLTTQSASLANAGGFLKVTGNQALSVTTTAALNNGSGGFIGGNGNVSVQAGSVSNAGQIYAGNALNVHSQSNLINDGGALQALSSLNAVAAGNFSNRSGRIEAGAGNAAASMTLSGASLDNTGGRIANAGSGLSTINGGASVLNQGGTLGGQGDVALNAGSLDNSANGHLVAGNDLNLSLGGWYNVGGTAYAARFLNWSNAAAGLSNASGNLGAGADLNLALASIDNSSGALAASRNVSLNLASLGGNGRVAAGQDLSLSLAGDYTTGGGSEWTANRDLSFNLAGSFTNAAGTSLQAVRNLSINAANISNASGATINSAGTTLNARGTLDNAGRIEGDTITLSAPTINNTATIIGGALTATAGNFINGADLGQATNNAAYQSALIATTDSLALYVGGTLLNRDATIFTLGNLSMAADAAGNRSVAVINSSGDIEADGDIYLAANQFTNQRRVFQTEVYTLTAAEQALNTYVENAVSRYRYDDSNPDHQQPTVSAGQVVQSGEVSIADAYCNAHWQSNSQRCRGFIAGGGSAQFFQSNSSTVVLSQTRLQSTSATSQLLAGGNITISGSVLNDKSTVAAGANLTINGKAGQDDGTTVRNIAWTPTAQLQQTTEDQVEYEMKKSGGDWPWTAWWTYQTVTTNVEQSLAPGQMPAWMNLTAGPSANAIMSAGNNVAITAHTIDNTVVGSDGQPVHAVIGLGSNSGSQAVSGQGGSTVGSVGGASGGGGVALGSAPTAIGGGSLNVSQGRGGVGGNQAPGAVAQTGTGPKSGSGRPVTVSTAPGGSPTGANPAAPQAVAGLVGPNASVSLPQSGLYTVTSNPSSPYLVETDPRFTNYTQYISSDYLLGKLNIDPAATEKRLGDGFYEERQVLDQIAQLTGRRYLDDNSDALSQYRDLMDAGAQAASAFNLSVGVALTGDQMANLTQDMVWMVNETVDGQQVLTPVVYLSAEHAQELAAGGATIAGKNVTLTATGDITNNGTIAASQNATLTASNLLNSGTVSAGGNLSITAAQDILNGGTINAGGNVSLVAGNDVRSGVSVAEQLGAVNLGNPGAPVSSVALGNLQLGSISAGGSLSVSAGRDLSLDTAPVKAGSDLSLAAGRDLTATATTISAGGSAQVLAGRDLSLDATGHTDRLSEQNKNSQEVTTHTVSTINAGGAVVVAAGRDITSQGAQLGGNTVAISAGRDVNLDAVSNDTLDTTYSSHGHKQVSSTTTSQTISGTSVSGTNGVAISAGHDATLTAATVSSAQGGVTLMAGNDVNLNAATQTNTWEQDTKKSSHGFLSSSTTKTHDATSDSYAIGSTVSGNSVIVAAGNDINATAVQLSANQGLALSAGHDVNLLAGQQTHTENQSTSVSESSLFNTSSTRFGSLDPESKSTKTSSSVAQSWSVGSTLSGDSVTIAAGHDITATAVQVAATHDVTVAAGNNLTLTNGIDTYSESHDKSVSSSGLMSGGGFNVVIGSGKQSKGDTLTQTTAVGSLVGSTDGKVTLSAGNDIHITGSDVLSQTGTAIVGKNVIIDAAIGTTDTTQTQKVSQSGVTVGISGGVADLALGASHAVKRGSEVKDDRLTALYAAQAAYDVKDAVPGVKDALNADSAKGAQAAAGVNFEVGLGGSSASSHTSTHDETSYGSHIQSGGDITIAATGGDLTIIGSQISGDNVALAAANNLTILSQAENHSLKNDSTNGSGGVGISIGSDGLGIYAQAAVGSSNTHGNGTTHAESQVDASGTLTLVSGDDTTIKGAQLAGNQVLAGIGHDLNIISEQDTDDYASKNLQAGGKVMVGITQSGFVSGSGYINQGKVDSHYQSVNEVSGIQAGDGGFGIVVGNHTGLVGGQIASTADPSKNLLSTGSLSYAELTNQSKYNASQTSFSGGSTLSSNVMGALGTGLSLATPQHENDTSTTQSGIAQGTLDIRSNPGQDLSGLVRDLSTLDANGIKNSFDPNKVAETQELGQVAGQLAFHAVKDVVSSQRDEAEKAMKAASNAYSAATTDEERAAATQQMQDAKASMAAWGDGGIYKVAAQTLAGAFQASMGGGNVLSAAAGVVADEAFLSKLGAVFNNAGLDADGKGHEVAVNLASAAMGWLAGSVAGGSGGSGASGATTAQLYGYFDYRDGRQQVLQWQSKDLEQMTGGNQATMDAAAYLLNKALKAGANPSDLAASLSAPGMAENFLGMVVVESTARQMFGGVSFDDLSDGQKQTVLTSVAHVSVGSDQYLNSDTVASAPAPLAGSTATESEASIQQQIGAAVSSVIVNSGLAVSKAVDWVGEDTATALGYLALTATGGPAKALESYLWNASPLGVALQNAQNDYLVNPAASLIGQYGFGAQDAAQQQAVYPASHAAGAMTVTSILSAIGGIGSEQGAKGIVKASEGFGDEVKKADDVGAIGLSSGTNPIQGSLPSATVEPKILGQMGPRGWTSDSISSTIAKPAERIVTQDTRFDPIAGTRRNDPATAYVNSDGSYVVVNDKDGTVVQISNRNDPNWKAPWAK
jgi:filamentous hemagglutinin